jgi:pantetheine-phosphate adenylyltransferase
MAEKKVAIGGTFDLLHAGHKALLKKSFELGQVKIGLVSDEMAALVKNRKVADFFSRKKELADFIKNDLGNEAEIFSLNDEFGRALTGDFDYIVTSPETYEAALLINKERRALGRNPLEIVKIDYVLAEDKKPISSTRISNGEIDKEGRLLK